MSLKVYNSLTDTKEDFEPLGEGRVRMYACGVTVYDHTHLGHARSAVVFDVIKRYLEYAGHEVKYVRNFTDIDDKIINKANMEGVECSVIAERFIKEYNQDMERLGVRDADVSPKATDHIPLMIELIEKLVDKGYAYQVGGSVYFSVKKFVPYGKLSKKDTEQLLSGARVEVDAMKGNPLDFALWKESKEGEPAWESPWGLGRPGWHIECSAMSMFHLGETIDIHGGGKDLIFPHHENEIAQSEAATGKEFVRYWMHNGFVNINREKMSKSAGNYFTVKEILENHHPEAVRLFLLSSHYRHPIDYSIEALKRASRALDRYYSMLREIEALSGASLDFSQANMEALDESGKELHGQVAQALDLFREAMNDDFNTARAIGQVFELVRRINRYLHSKAGDLGVNESMLLGLARKAMGEIGGVLGLFHMDSESWFKRKLETAGRETEVASLDEEYIESRIKEREEARRKRDWGTADSIRKELTDMGLVLEDAPQGTRWKVRG